MYIVGCYVSYLLISLVATIWVARTLHKNGRVFLVDAFHGNAELADSVNHLSVVGLYLVNLGYAVLTLTTAENLATRRAAIEAAVSKIGGGLLFLGFTLFVDLFILSRIGKRSFRAGSGLDVPLTNPVTAGPTNRA
jgi:hypothetical protein